MGKASVEAGEAVDEVVLVEGHQTAAQMSWGSGAEAGEGRQEVSGE